MLTVSAMIKPWRNAQGVPVPLLCSQGSEPVQWRTSCLVSTSTCFGARSRCSKCWICSAFKRPHAAAINYAGRVPSTVRHHPAVDRFPSTCRADDINASTVDREGISWSCGPRLENFRSTKPRLISVRRSAEMCREADHHEQKGTEKRNRYLNQPRTSPSNQAIHNS